MKIRFSSDDDLPLHKALHFHAMTVIIRTVFEENGKYCPPFVLNERLCKVLMFV